MVDAVKVEAVRKLVQDTAQAERRHVQVGQVHQVCPRSVALAWITCRGVLRSCAAIAAIRALSSSSRVSVAFLLSSSRCMPRAVRRGRACSGWIPPAAAERASFGLSYRTRRELWRIAVRGASDRSCYTSGLISFSRAATRRTPFSRSVPSGTAPAAAIAGP